MEKKRLDTIEVDIAILGGPVETYVFQEGEDVVTAVTNYLANLGYNSFVFSFEMADGETDDQSDTDAAALEEADDDENFEFFDIYVNGELVDSPDNILEDGDYIVLVFADDDEDITDADDDN